MQAPWETRRQYYEKLYKRKEQEEDEDYYKRILGRKPHETDSQYVKRLVTLHKVFPKLDVWQDERYMEYVSPGVSQSQIEGSQQTDGNVSNTATLVRNIDSM